MTTNLALHIPLLQSSNNILDNLFHIEGLQLRERPREGPEPNDLLALDRDDEIPLPRLLRVDDGRRSRRKAFNDLRCALLEGVSALAGLDHDVEGCVSACILRYS